MYSHIIRIDSRAIKSHIIKSHEKNLEKNLKKYASSRKKSYNVLSNRKKALKKF